MCSLFNSYYSSFTCIIYTMQFLPDVTSNRLISTSDLILTNIYSICSEFYIHVFVFFLSHIIHIILSILCLFLLKLFTTRLVGLRLYAFAVILFFLKLYSIFYTTICHAMHEKTFGEIKFLADKHWERYNYKVQKLILSQV